MQVQFTHTNLISNQNKNIAFKNVYPVRVWVREMGGGYVPVVSRDLSKTLSTKIVNILNKSKNELIQEYNKLCNIEKIKGKSKGVEIAHARLKIINWIKDFVAKFDKDYQKQSIAPNLKPHTRSFCVKSNLNTHNMRPSVYLLTGDDSFYFDKTFGKPIGLAKKISAGQASAETEIAKNDYWQKGYYYTQKRAKEFKINDKPAELHVKMETVRAKTGNIKGYNITGIGFFPQNGPQNPLELTEWLKK